MLDYTKGVLDTRIRIPSNKRVFTYYLLLAEMVWLNRYYLGQVEYWFGVPTCSLPGSHGAKRREAKPETVLL